MKLDLFKLHLPEDSNHDRTWILAKGKDLRKQVSHIKSELSKIMSNDELLNEIAKNAGITLRINLNDQSVTEWLMGIKKLRIKRKISFRKMETYNIYNVSKIEKGKSIPKCKILKKLNKIVGLEIKQTCDKNDFCLHLLNFVFSSINSNSEWIPLIVVSSLLKIYREKFEINDKKFIKIKNDVIDSIEYLKINNNTSKPVKAVKELNKDLAKIVGSFAADGNYATARMIRWEEEYEEILQILSSWFERIFGIKLKYEHSKRDRNSFVMQLTNKIVCRYLKIFFDFDVGEKRYTVDEPSLIKQQTQEIRKAFATGALMADGSVNFDGSIYFSSVSKKFRDSIAEILIKDDIPLCVSSKSILRLGRAPKWELRTLQKPNITSLKRMLTYFEKGSSKWRILNLYTNGLSDHNIKNIYELFPKNNVINKLKLIEKIKKLKKFDVYVLMRMTKLSRRCLLNYLRLFEVLGILNFKIVNGKRIYLCK